MPASVEDKILALQERVAYLEMQLIALASKLGLVWDDNLDLNLASLPPFSVPYDPVAVSNAAALYTPSQAEEIFPPGWDSGHESDVAK